MRPCVSDPPLCRYHELFDGTISLMQLADFHETLDELSEYRRRLKAVHDRKAAK